MTYQRLLRKLFASGMLPASARDRLERRVWTVEAGEAAGLKLRFPQNPDYVLGTSELPVQRCLARCLAPGGVFYDIGANVGFFSLLAARKVGPEGVVYAFEPVSENAAAIRRNASLNGLANVRVLEVAAGDRSGPGELLLTQWDGGSSLADVSVAPKEPTERRAVVVVALDELVKREDLRAPTVVKIDVEGAEMSTLVGMQNLLATLKPVVVYEVDDGDALSFDRRWRELDAFMISLGYDVTRLESSYPDLRWNVGHSLAVAPAAHNVTGRIEPGRSGEVASE